MSVYESILDAVVSTVQGLNLVASAGQVVKRKLPTVEEQLETLPIICVVPSPEPLHNVNIAFNVRSIKHQVLVVLVRANNGDQLTGLSNVCSFPESMRAAFPGPLLPGVAAVYELDVDDSPVIDLSQISSNYDYLPFMLHFTAAEQRAAS